MSSFQFFAKHTDQCGPKAVGICREGSKESVWHEEDPDSTYFPNSVDWSEGVYELQFAKHQQAMNKQND